MLGGHEVITSVLPRNRGTRQRRDEWGRGRAVLQAFAGFAGGGRDYELRNTVFQKVKKVRKWILPWTFQKVQLTPCLYPARSTGFLSPELSYKNMCCFKLEILAIHYSSNGNLIQDKYERSRNEGRVMGGWTRGPRFSHRTFLLRVVGPRLSPRVAGLCPKANPTFPSSSAFYFQES